MTLIIPMFDDKKPLTLRILQEHTLCDDCLGRLLRDETPRDMNANDYGAQLRKETGLPDTTTSVQDCELCQGLISEIPKFADLIRDTLKDYEYATFLLGCRFTDDILAIENAIIKEYNLQHPETIKMQINREVGLLVEKATGKLVSFQHPDIMVKLDTGYDIVDLQIQPAYFYARYRKLSRDLPQTHWTCNVCMGVGCRSCNYRGKLWSTSVEELTCYPLMDELKGTDESFHGCGREDVDARMLGTGRPFIMEIDNPLKRTLDCSSMEEKINKESGGKIEIGQLRPCVKSDIERLKSAAFAKTYEVLIEGERTYDAEKLKEACRILSDCTIDQFTPSRVAHRRSNRIRKRKIYKCDVGWLSQNHARVYIEAESGTYIKELISGDDGKTQPNISELIGNPSTVKELDVLEIHGE